MSLKVNRIELTGVISPTQITTDEDNYNPTDLDQANLLRIGATFANLSITGIQGGVAGRVLYISNRGAIAITLPNQDSGSTAANRFNATEDVVLEPNHEVAFMYDGVISRWQLVGFNRSIRYITWRVLGDTTDQAVATKVGGDFEWQFAGTIVSIGAYDDTAGTTGTATYDVNSGGSTIMTTDKISIETTEKSSRDAATQPVVTNAVVAVGDIYTADIDAIQTVTAAKGLTIRFGIRES